MTGLLRKVTAVLALAIAVFLFAGCGGSETTATKPARSAKTTAAASNSMATDLIGQVVVPGALSPDDFKKSIESRRPIVVTFYITGSGGPADDNQVRSSIMELESMYRGQVDFYTYNYTDADDYGDLTLVLKVATTPTVIIINQQAQVQRAWSGYVDKTSIEQGINEAAGIAGSSSRSSYNTSTSSSAARSSTTGTTNNMNSGTISDEDINGPTP